MDYKSLKYDFLLENTTLKSIEMESRYFFRNNIS